MLAARSLWVTSSCVLLSGSGAFYGCSANTPRAQTSGGAPPAAAGDGGGGLAAAGGTMTMAGMPGQAGTTAGTPAQAGAAAPAAGGSPLAGGALAGGSAGFGGGAAGAPVTLKGPILRNGRCVLEFGASYFESDPAVGGRILSARTGTREALVPSSVHAENFGSTFWTAPQADWSWPPVATIDKSGYTAMADAVSCTMTSAKVSGETFPVMNDIVIVKKFSADLEKEAMIVEYTIRNEGAAAKRFAPWEITRVAPDGLTFFATDATPTGMKLPMITTAAGAVWYKDAATVAHDSKLFCDGKGWIAHVTPDNVLLVKSFPDIAAAEAAPKEAEIEVYTSNPPASMPGGARYVEVENLGAYSEIAPGAALTWTVRWYVRALPSTVMATPGNAALVTFVQQLIAP